MRNEKGLFGNEGDKGYNLKNSKPISHYNIRFFVTNFLYNYTLTSLLTLDTLLFFL